MSTFFYFNNSKHSKQAQKIKRRFDTTNIKKNDKKSSPQLQALILLSQMTLKKGKIIKTYIISKISYNFKDNTYYNCNKKIYFVKFYPKSKT